MRGHSQGSGLCRGRSNRFRVQATILMGVLLLGAVAWGGPVAAADAQADYLAAFSACQDMPSSGFIDLARTSPNAGDIDCIAYYGITKGTSENTFSPSMSVSREQMALFLVRVARLVGIDMVSDPSDPGFLDIADLPEESQVAIAQLADLGITRGTSAGAYSPWNSVSRGHMALFIQRLMNRMDPMADGAIRYGYTPEDVVDDPGSAPAKRLGSPFTDLGGATKDEYDAITQLWELGVVRGVSTSAYAPRSAISRASMAGMIAGLLDHSNARPSGLSVQASTVSGIGGSPPTIVVSYRDDRFAPIVGRPIQVTDTATIKEWTGSYNCLEDGRRDQRCSWPTSNERTDARGNCFVEGWADDDGPNTYVAWIPDDQNPDFSFDSRAEATVTIEGSEEVAGIEITSDLNAHALRRDTANDADYDDDEPRANLDHTASVTLTAQLVSGKGTPISRPNVAITVGLEQRRYTEGQTQPGPVVYGSATERVSTTDEKGRVTFTVSRPRSTRGAGNDPGRADTVTFSGAGSQVIGEAKLIWTDDPAELASGKGAVSSPYAVIANGKITVRASAYLYDQYGNGAGRGHTVLIGIGSGTANPRQVNRRGVAVSHGAVAAYAGIPIRVTFTDIRDVQGRHADPPALTSATVMPVVHADDGSSGATPADIGGLYAQDNRFHLGGVLYTYKPADTFVLEGKTVDIEAFETALGADLDLTGPFAQSATVEVVLYNYRESSIFSITRAADDDATD